MDRSREEAVIHNYQKGEKMMILLFAQWCINHELDPAAIYTEAYPYQDKNKELVEALELTVTKEESDFIDSGMLLEALSLYGNDDLAFVVSELVSKKNL
ncbi:hypothetical protein QRD89_03195 [Halobacillus sp. ACCC02827]|uniref:hypothetical protein n=2 Tax=unclassified Halobacillus TaxID=2636472 RepID=UPI000783D3AD|nr:MULTISPECIES: hypothetical protein [unclassified Halobacillus]WJE16375.1 hypothetical protein QRD89_03195 [Halobacillus sp. ACCC02827]